MAKLEATRSSTVFNGWVLAIGALGMSLINLLVVTPWTSKLMFQRHRLEKQEGKSYSDPSVSTAETRWFITFYVAVMLRYRHFTGFR